MKNARKLFRLFKTFQEYVKAKQMFMKADLDHKMILFLLTRACFGGYWIFDNIVVLSSIKVLKYDAKKMNKIGATFWFFALLFSIIGAVIKLVDLSEKQSALAKKEDSEDKKKGIKQIERAKFEAILVLIKCNGDLITSSSASEIAPKLGINFSESHIGLGGFTSAVISMYQAWG